MSRPPLPPAPHPASTITTTTAAAAITTASPAMTETQTPPNIPPSSFYVPPFSRHLPHPGPILPPLSIPGPPQRPDIHFRSPIATTNNLPSILNPPVPLPARPPHRQHSSGPAPFERIISSQPQPFTPPKSESFSPQQYGPPALSPRSEAEARPPRAMERYHYDDQRPRYPDSTLTSPIEQTHAQSMGPLPSPGYTPSYTSTAREPGSHRSSTTSSLGPLPSYQDPAPAPAPPSRRPGPSASSLSRPPPPIIEKNPFQYELTVRQQPIAARACGFGERDRRVIDPPPIIQLSVTDPKTGQAVQDELRYSLNVVHCTLWDAEGTSEQTALVQADRRTTRRLMGQLVASPSVAKDEHDVEGCFFCFPDLSCRTHGRYKLRFVLMRIDPMNLHVGGFSPILTEVFSDVFTVYTAKDFPGMRPSSALTRALKLQGCNIQVKKGNDKSFRKRVSASVEGDDDDDVEPGKGKRRRRD